MANLFECSLYQNAFRFVLQATRVKWHKKLYFRKRVSQDTMILAPDYVWGVNTQELWHKHVEVYLAIMRLSLPIPTTFILAYSYLWFPWQQDTATTAAAAEGGCDGARSPTTESRVDLLLHGSLTHALVYFIDIKDIDNVSVLMLYNEIYYSHICLEIPKLL